MLKWLIVAAFAFGGYQLYHKGFFGNGAAAVGKDGKPLVVLFVGPGCGEHCEGVRELLKARGMRFEEIDVAGTDGAPVPNKYGVNSYPTTLIGKVQVQGADLPRITAALAEQFGKNALSRSEQVAMDGHFDAGGKAKVVLYGTKWCGYCKAQRELFAAQNIPFDDIDVEASDAAMLAYSALKGSGYPLTYVGYRRFEGFQEGPLLAAVGELSGRPQKNVR
jgi:glutaredoxin